MLIRLYWWNRFNLYTLILQCMFIRLVILVIIKKNYSLCILGHKLKCFVDLSQHRCEQKGKCSFLNWLNKFFLQFNWFHIFNALTFILQCKLPLFSCHFLSYVFKNRTTQFIIFSCEQSLFDLTETMGLIPHLHMFFVLLQAEPIIIFHIFFFIFIFFILNKKVLQP